MFNLKSMPMILVFWGEEPGQKCHSKEWEHGHTRPTKTNYDLITPNVAA